MPIELGCILLCKCTTYFILHQKILQKTSSHTYFTYRKILSSHLPPPHNKGAPPAALRLRAVRPKRAKVLLNKNFLRLSIRVADDVHTLLESIHGNAIWGENLERRKRCWLNRTNAGCWCINSGEGNIVSWHG